MILDKCECYHEEICYKPVYNVNGQKIGQSPYIQGYCLGTKESEHCTCGGDPSKCNFYKNKRKEANMDKKETYTTAEMWLKAQENGRLYCSGDMAYSTKHGFVNLNDFCDIWEPNNFGSIDEIMELEWQEAMTISEAEEKLGVRIIEN